jgi:acyl-CoA reductase-like NAD-dependent aldehyde dehydrogenase
MTDYHAKQLINGEWVDAGNGGTWDLVNPATEEVIQQIPFGDGSDTTAAIDAAHEAFKSWSRMSPHERGGILAAAAGWIGEHINELSVITTKESGKPVEQAALEWQYAMMYFSWYAEEGKRAYGQTMPMRLPNTRVMTIKQPMGVIGTITAWNFPVYNVVRCWAAILGAGCTIVAKPAEHTPRSAMLLAQALVESGLPAGVVNLVNGDPAETGRLMLEDPRVRKISFTGSTEVGKLLMDGASKTVTGLALELGGNAPAIIMPDAGDMGVVAQGAMSMKLLNNGQMCTTPQRFFVHEDVVEPFTEAMVAVAGAVKLGNGLEEETQVGPLINAAQRERVEAIVNDSVAVGAQVAVGGERPSEFERGYFYRPTVMTEVPTSARIYQEEVFGPVLPIVPFSDLDEALALANDTEYGLAAYVQTTNIKTAIYMYENLEYGMIGINDWLPALPESPFGGTKQSGLGRESGQQGMDEYMEAKAIFISGLA